jgi:hypothetical protein
VALSVPALETGCPGQALAPKLLTLMVPTCDDHSIIILSTSAALPPPQPPDVRQIPPSPHPHFPLLPWQTKCDRQFPCSRCKKLGRTCQPQTRGRGRPIANTNTNTLIPELPSAASSEDEGDEEESSPVRPPARNTPKPKSEKTAKRRESHPVMPSRVLSQLSLRDHRVYWLRMPRAVVLVLLMVVVMMMMMMMMMMM